MTGRTYLISFTVQYCFLFRFVCIELVSLIWFLQIWVAIYVYGTMINWSTLIKKLMQTYIVIVSGSILNVSTVHLNGIWHLIWRYLLKPVLGGHPVLSGHYSFPRGVNVHRELSTPVWIENVLSAEWNPGFVYNMECERIPCSRRSDSRARSFFFFLSSWIFLPRSAVWTPGTGQAASERIYV